MDFSELFICRGCASVVAGDPVSLMDPGVKDLYQKCTYQLVNLHCERETDIYPRVHRMCFIILIYKFQILVLPAP